MRSLQELLDAGVAGRTILLRADLNVPLSHPEGGAAVITDDGRIRAALPTLQRLTEAGARVVVVSHLGRPKGADPAASLGPVGVRLAQLRHGSVAVASDLTGADARDVVAALGDGDVALLENVRFDPRETSKDPAQRSALAAELASLVGADAFFVQDAFGAVHRSHASVSEIAARLPSYVGLLVQEELDVLRRLTTDPQRPYVVVLGGSKVSDKLAVIQALLPMVDRILVGGGMCFTFLAAQGHEVGKSLLEPEQIDICRDLLKGAGARIVLPVDVVAASSFSADADHAAVGVDAIPADRMGLDIGPRSVELFSAAIAHARTVFWNGPMGVFELSPFAAGTEGIVRSVAQAADHGAFTVVGGGDSAAAVRLLGPAVGVTEDRFGHISTGGGASLEHLEGKLLPGLAALEGAA